MDKDLQINDISICGGFDEPDIADHTIRPGQPCPREVLSLQQAVEPTEDPADSTGGLRQGLDEDAEPGEANLQVVCVPDEPSDASGSGLRHVVPPCGCFVDVAHGNYLALRLQRCTEMNSLGCSFYPEAPESILGAP